MSLTLPAAAAAFAAIAMTGTANWAPRIQSGSAGLPDPGARIELVGGDAVGTPPVFVPPRLSPRVKTDQVNPDTTAAIVAALNESTRFCSGLTGDRKAFVVDCIAERMHDVSRRMERNAGYEDVRAVLENTSRQLEQLARANKSRTTETTRFRSRAPDGRVTGTQRRLVPVADDKLDDVMARAVSVIGQAETQLLRSSESSAERAAQFQRIAAAIGSNKVLLRSTT